MILLLVCYNVTILLAYNFAKIFPLEKFFKQGMTLLSFTQIHK